MRTVDIECGPLIVTVEARIVAYPTRRRDEATPDDIEWTAEQVLVEGAVVGCTASQVIVERLRSQIGDALYDELAYA